MTHLVPNHSLPQRRPGRFTLALATAALLATTLTPNAWAAGSKGGIQPTNPENPWDYIGQLHNQALDNIATDLVAHTPDPNPTQVSMSIWKEAVRISEDKIGDLDIGAFPFDSLADAATGRGVDLSGLDEEQQSYASQVLEIAGSPDYGPQEKIAALIQLEGEVAERLDSKRAFPILASSAVGRYSTAYWHSQDAETSPWNLYPDTGSFEGALESPNQIIEADVGGAIAFFVLGPEGMLIGAAIGSAFSIAGAIWDWLF